MSPSRAAAVPAALALLLAGCGGHGAAGPVAPDRPNTLTAAESKAGWRLLFDGSTTKGWRGNHADHGPNGRRTVPYERGSADWRRRVAASKFKEWPQYGKAPQGYIGLQDHGDRVAFRNIKIRVLK